MPRHEIFDELGLDELGFGELGILRIENWLKVNRAQIAALFGKVSTLVENVGDAAIHAGGKISPTGPEHQDQPLRHVFAAVVANSLDYRGRSGVANRKPLACDPVEKRFAAGGAVERAVANQDVLFGGETRPSRRIHHQRTRGQGPRSRGGGQLLRSAWLPRSDEHSAPAV